MNRLLLGVEITTRLNDSIWISVPNFLQRNCLANLIQNLLPAAVRLRTNAPGKFLEVGSPAILNEGQKSGLGPKSNDETWGHVSLTDESFGRLVPSAHLSKDDGILFLQGGIDGETLYNPG